ncbi:MAG TPA: hypothetical protein VJ439_00835, partial [Candidatus Bathyarchaeia archaeon]|nr:hypothetical protein [Candidatus Bathyarchaeia archaeon]
IPTDGLKYKQLDGLIVTSKERTRLKRDKEYYYIEIGDVDIHWGRIEYHRKFGFFIPESPLKVKAGDIIVSKVRTYRKGIAFVDKDSDSLTCTPAFLLIRSVTDEMTKEYLYAVLRHDVFVEQILALQNRGSYPRLDKHVAENVLIPISKDRRVMEYLTCLTKALIRKNEELESKSSKMQKMLETEIVGNQISGTFAYLPPRYQDLKNEKRLDTGLYNEEYKKILFLLENYSEGFFLVPEDKFKSGSTPEKRIIGIGNKNWITPTIISDYGYFESEEKILTDKSNLTKDCALIINRTFKGGLGEYVGISVFYDYSAKGIGHHNQGLYRVEDYPEEQLKMIAILLNSNLYRKLCGHISLGSKMREIKISDFAQIPFPKIRKEVAQELVKYYSQKAKYPFDTTLENFSAVDDEITKASGMLELSYQIAKINSQISDTIDKMIKGKPIELSIDFLMSKLLPNEP